MKELPPLTPPYTGGGEVSFRFREITKRSLPLCKGEPEGVVLANFASHFQFSILNFQFSIIKSGVKPDFVVLIMTNYGIDNYNEENRG